MTKAERMMQLAVKDNGNQYVENLGLRVDIEDLALFRKNFFEMVKVVGKEIAAHNDNIKGSEVLEMVLEEMGMGKD